MRAFANSKLHVAQVMKFVSKKVENIMGKGENAVNQYFLLFSKCFQKASFFTVVKALECLYERVGKE